MAAWAPARRFAGAGACFVCVVSAACDRVPVGGGPPTVELSQETVRLDPGVGLHDVVVRREQGGEFHPARLQARQGDVVRFTTEDRGGHAIVFGPTLDPAARSFLEQSGQLRSPPLIETGASWVITFADAPPGEYPFHCTTHNVAGVLTLTPR
jgi:plastocyanin